MIELPAFPAFRLGYYRHRKTGRRYLAVSLARVEARPKEIVVVYHAHEDALRPPERDGWTRPLAEFIEQFELSHGPLVTEEQWRSIEARDEMGDGT